MLEINIKRYLNISHLLSSAMWHLLREIFDLAIENLGKVKRLKKKPQRMIAEKKAFIYLFCRIQILFKFPWTIK